MRRGAKKELSYILLIIYVIILYQIILIITMFYIQINYKFLKIIKLDLKLFDLVTDIVSTITIQTSKEFPRTAPLELMNLLKFKIMIQIFLAVTFFVTILNFKNLNLGFENNIVN